MKQQRHWLTRLVNALLVIIALVVVVHITCLTQVNLTHDGFAPTLRAGDHLVVYRWAYSPWPSITAKPQIPTKLYAQRGQWVWAYRPDDVKPDGSDFAHWEKPLAERAHTLGLVQAVAGDTLWLDTAKRAVYLTPQTHTLPLVVPGPDVRVRLQPWNIHLMLYTLRHHEHYDSTVAYVNDSTLLISGKECNEVAFSQPYYWLGMPHASATRGAKDTIDSYHYGFMPHDHLRGRVLFISYSWQDSTGMDWGRSCRTLPQ